ncbi:hypothetical protein M2408_002692 [Sphingobacterium sp. BIGb0165]|nr:hypothetical protein [Sphingobacterium sp. BIGb0165]
MGRWRVAEAKFTKPFRSATLTSLKSLKTYILLSLDPRIVVLRLREGGGTPTHSTTP